MNTIEIIQLIGRIVLGGFFIFNGVGHFTSRAVMTEYAKIKSIPAPRQMVVISGAILILAGLGIIIGLATTLSLWALSVTMIIFAFGMHRFWSTPHEYKHAEFVNFTKNIALAAAILMLLSIPLPWALSLGM